MKRNTVLIDLKGNIGDYVKTIYTQQATNDVDIRSLQTSLNVQIKKSLNLPATNDNCKKLWESLTTIVKQFKVSDANNAVFKEIVKAVDNIGREIAYIGYRKGWKYRPIAIFNDYDDNELVMAFKIILVNQYNDTKIIPAGYMSHDEYVKDILDGKGYSTMTDEELLIEAKKMQEFINNERNNGGFKLTGTDE